MQARTRQLQQDQISLEYVVSGRIGHFDPGSLPGGILSGIRVHAVPDCFQLSTCNGEISSQDIAVSSHFLNDPVEDVEKARELDQQATKQLNSAADRLKRIMKALKQSAELQQQVEEKISQIKSSNILLEQSVNKIIDNEGVFCLVIESSLLFSANCSALSDLIDFYRLSELQVTVYGVEELFVSKDV